MANRHINFSPYQVRAALDGRLSQTRLVLKHKSIELGIAPSVEVGHPEWIQFLHPKGGPLTCVKWPYAIGDRLYVREAFSCDGQSAGEHMYRATVDDDTGYYAEEIAEIRWRPSIHMPRLASRLTLIVTDVRVQRLQEISEEDAMAEGCEASGWRPTCSDPDNAGGGESASATDAFADLWNSVHGPDAWATNPWVAALTFDVIRANIDSPEAAQ